MTPEQRSMRARLAAETRWSKPGARKQQSEKIAGSRLAAHERRIDPNGELDPAERHRLAKSALSAEMTRLALKSSQARRAS